MSESSGSSLFNVTTILAGVSILVTISASIYLYRNNLELQRIIDTNNNIILQDINKRVLDENRARTDAINEVTKKVDSLRSITNRTNTHINNVKGSVNELDVNINKLFDIINDQSEKITELTERLETLQDDFDELKLCLPEDYLPAPKLSPKKKQASKKVPPKAPQFKKSTVKKPNNNNKKPNSTLINEDNNETYDNTLDDEIDEFNSS